LKYKRSTEKVNDKSCRSERRSTMQSNQTSKGINSDPTLSDEVLGNIVNFLEQSWKMDLLSELKRGSLRVSGLSCQIVVPQQVYERAALQIGASVLPDLLISWIDDLEKEGVLSRDGETLTGLGEYAQIPLSDTEEEIVSVLRSVRGRTMTETGVLRKMKGSGLSDEQIAEGLGGLVKKGYVWANEVNKAGRLLFTAL
jgi:hypothetical protein